MIKLITTNIPSWIKRIPNHFKHIYLLYYKGNKCLFWKLVHVFIKSDRPLVFEPWLTHFWHINTLIMELFETHKETTLVHFRYGSYFLHSQKRHIKLHMKLQALRLVNHNLTTCHTLSKLHATKQITCQSLGFYLRPNMMRLKMSMHFSKLKMKKMNMMFASCEYWTYDKESPSFMTFQSNWT